MVVFYYVTTFSFESVRNDSLRDFGFSKDAKFKEVQVVMGLLVDREGRPIGYDLFPGNTFEGKTLDVALLKLEKRFGIRKVIIVADKGINSKINLKKITDRGYDYIWTDPRIKGHFVICFLAFLLERTLEFKLKRAHLSASPQQIREALNSMNFVEVKIKQKNFLIKTMFNTLGNKILRLSRIKPPPNVTQTSELSL